jgi:hypothetical protein
MLPGEEGMATLGWINRTILVGAYIALWFLIPASISQPVALALMAGTMVIAVMLLYAAWKLRRSIDTYSEFGTSEYDGSGRRHGVFGTLVFLLIYPIYRIAMPLLYFGASLYFLNAAYPGQWFAPGQFTFGDFALFCVGNFAYTFWLDQWNPHLTQLASTSHTLSIVSALFVTSVLVGVAYSWMRGLGHMLFGAEGRGRFVDEDYRPPPPNLVDIMGGHAEETFYSTKPVKTPVEERLF